MKRKLVFTVLTTVFLISAIQLFGLENNTLRVATRETPPFSYKDKDGKWKGISIELWKDIARANDYKFTIQETTLEDFLKGIKNNKYDVGVGGITITSDRTKEMTFSQPFISSSMGIAYMDTGNPWMDVLGKFLSVTFLRIVLALAAVLLLAGFVVWLFERKRNEEFGGKTHKGLGSAFWWSAVTMTTVGYGDKSPRTAGGRIVGLLWMFTSVIILTSFTAAIVSSLTLASTKTEVTIASMKSRRVGTIPDSIAADILKKNNIKAVKFNSCKEMADALSKHKVDYIVYDLPMLRFYGTNYGPQFTVEALKKYRMDYGFVVQLKSPLLKPINIELLSIIHQPAWQTLKIRYLGKGSADVYK